MTTDCLFTLESEIESCMEALLRAIVSEVADIFRSGVSASEDPFRGQLRRSSGMLVRRVVFTLTKFLRGSFGDEIAQMKREIETLRGRLQVWGQQAAGSGGDRDRGQTDRLGHTPPGEVIVEVKEETDPELELSGAGWSEVGALADAGEGAPLEQQCSEEEEEEEWGSVCMQETELLAAERKEQLGEQHRSRVEDLGGPEYRPSEQRPESVARYRQAIGDRDAPNRQGAGDIPRSGGGAESVSVRGQKEEGRGDLDAARPAGQAAEDLRASDQGSYTVRDLQGNTIATVGAHRDTVTLQPGASLSVPLFTGEPVEVLFDPAGGGNWTSVCSVQNSTARCVPQYTDRVSVQNSSLTLYSLTPADQRSYRVRDLQGNTISTVIVTVGV
nr:PREDICTED: uncharacterized protein LOC107076034 [Lepisosteus oculatus]